MNARPKSPMKTRPNTTSKNRFTLSLKDEKVREFAEDKAKRKFDNNLSLYVRTLIRQDMVREEAA